MRGTAVCLNDLGSLDLTDQARMLLAWWSEDLHRQYELAKLNKQAADILADKTKDHVLKASELTKDFSIVVQQYVVLVFRRRSRS